MKFLITFTLLPLFCISALSSDLPTAETRLDKLSKTLRGVPANLQERQSLANFANAGRTDEFLRMKAEDYLKSEHFEMKLKRNIDELYRMKTELTLPGDNNPALTDAYHVMVRKVIHENLSWDELILNKSYKFSEKFRQSISGMNEQQYYDILMDNKEPEMTLEEQLATGGFGFDPQKKAKDFEYNFDRKDPRVAGVLTTARFLNRYVNTALNKNRRRAATLFRVFLCDPMVASVPARSNESDNADLDLVYPKGSAGMTSTEEELRQELKPNDPHGSQPDCRACHDKLDPVGRVFAFSAKGMHFKPSPGALSYRSKQGQKVKIPVSGVGELAEKFTQQKDYQSCQVKHFWRWYVGQDVPLSEAREVELVNTFNQLGRKPKDFVAYLVQSKEFNQKPRILTAPQTLARRATRILKNCNSCHTQSDVEEMMNWDLTELPYGKNQASRTELVQKLKDALDIENDGRYREMPPKNSMWKLSEDDFQILKKWLTTGAPDYEGRLQVPAEAR